MTRLLLGLTTSLSVLVSGCATTSFAPPSVNTARHVSIDQSGQCPPTVGRLRVDNRDSVRSAVLLIENYATTYKCALAEASNGRQFFQIPTYLSALIGVAGGAFGGGRDLAVGTGIAASTFNSANGYWDPQAKAGILDRSFDAILCIKGEAVGNAFYDTAQDPKKANFLALIQAAKISVPVEWRYYALISTALSQVDRITGDRLRGVGKYDPAGLVAEIEALKSKIDEEEQVNSSETATNEPPGDAEAPTEAEVPTEASTGSDEDTNTLEQLLLEDAADGKIDAEKTWSSYSARVRSQGTFDIDLDELKPKLERCVLRAKL